MSAENNAISATDRDPVIESTPSGPAPKRKRARAAIIAGVTAAIIIVAGAGFWVWHEQPSFCGAICHTPMDN